MQHGFNISEAALLYGQVCTAADKPHWAAAQCRVSHPLGQIPCMGADNGRISAGVAQTIVPLCHLYPCPLSTALRADAVQARPEAHRKSWQC